MGWCGLDIIKIFIDLLKDKSPKLDEKLNNLPLQQQAPLLWTHPLKPHLNTKNSEQERFAILRLIRSHGIGPKRFFNLYRHYGNAQSVIENFSEVQAVLSHVRLSALSAVEEEWERSHRQGVHLVAVCDDTFPSLLKTIQDCPPLLSVLGSLAFFQKRYLFAIVGSRQGSLQGQHFVKRLVGELGENNFCIVSGLALGIDTAAHEAALPFGTVAVLAGGVDKVYPPENQKLYEQIQERGCIVSEMPLGQEPQAKCFPRRNRLISGLASGVLVVEGRFQSGSLLTAQYAVDQGREVFAVPGSPLDPRCFGSNLLLKQGATLVTRGEDILQVLTSPQYSVRKESEEPFLQRKEGGNTEHTQLFLSLLGDVPVPREQLLSALGWSAEQFNTVCAQLELEGTITYFPGSQIGRSVK